MMHSILSSLPREVLYELCYAILHPSRHKGLKILSSLARTCRLFHEPAVGAIWNRIPDILTLIHTLPEDLWLETHVKITRDDHLYRFFTTRLSFKRPPVQSDFARLKHYAYRIYHIASPNTCLIPPDILSALAIYFPAGTLLPNIRTLIYRFFTPPPPESHQSLQVFFGPKLRSILLIRSAPCQVRDAEHADVEDFDCLRELPRMCPGLSVLNVRMVPEPKLPLLTVVPEIVCGFRDLAHALVGRILLDFPAILHLAKLRNLNTLYACLSDKITQANVHSLTSTASTSGQAYFPSLRNISLTHRFLSHSTSLLKIVSSPVLSEVTLSTSGESGIYCSSEDVAELFVELSRHPYLIDISVSVHSPLTGAPFDQTTLEPLLVLSSLRILDIDIGHTLDVDDEFVAFMAFAWPNLVILMLCVGHPRLDPAALHPTMTLVGLASFAVWCPELLRIGLPVNTDMSRIPPLLLETRPARGAGLSDMFYLNVGLSVVNDPVPVAAFLSDLFPRLEEVRTAWGQDMEEDMNAALDGDVGRPEEMMARWNQVAHLVDDFRAVRNQERNWAAAHGMGRSVDVSG